MCRLDDFASQMTTVCTITKHRFCLQGLRSSHAPPWAPHLANPTERPGSNTGRMVSARIPFNDLKVGETGSSDLLSHEANAWKQQQTHSDQA